MKFDKYLPIESLRPYIKHFVVSENSLESEYRVYPSTSLVIGFQYKGELSIINENKENKLDSSGVTGISDTYKTFKNSADIGSILVFFTEIGFTHFSSGPVNELFNLSISLDNLFDKENLREVLEKLYLATSDRQRISIVEQFLLAQYRNHQTDKLIVEAVRLIHQTNGTIRIKDLNQKLFISQSPLEKRFRKTVGTTPKKFASIVRFNTVLNKLDKLGSSQKHFFQDHYFDQAHFIKNFKHFTGQTPENFKRFL